MPFIPFLAALLLVFVFILSTPLLLVVRYRVGTARRPARRWLATINLLSLLASAALFSWAAAITNFWVPNTFRYSLIGSAAGALLGLFGLWLTRWEPTARALYYKPNRWLVLLLTLAVGARLVYGFWRIWYAWHTTGRDASWLASAGIPGSMAVGAFVLGYYLTYFGGVRWRLASSARSRVNSNQMPRILLLIFCFTTVVCGVASAFPVENEMRDHLRVGMTVDEVLTTFGEPQVGSRKTSGPSRLLYVSPIGMRTVEAKGYVGFEVQLLDGKVQSWRTITDNPSYAPMHVPREVKWYGYVWILFLVGAFLYGGFRAFRRGMSEEQLLLKAYKERQIPRLPEEFRFINNDTTLQEVTDRIGPPTRERKFPIDPRIVRSGYGYTEGPLDLPAIVLIEYDLPYHSVVALLPEFPFQPENRIRAAFYRRPLPDEEL